MILLQLSAGQGPEECALAVAKALRRLLTEAEAARVEVRVLDEEAGTQRGTLRSVLLALQGERAETLAVAWSGSLQWGCSSPYRPSHGRKNWFFGGALFARRRPAWKARSASRRCARPVPVASSQHHRLGGARHSPGQRHQCQGQSERSQHANRRLALLLIARRLAERAEEADERLRAERRLRHHNWSGAIRGARSAASVSSSRQ